MKRKTIKVDDTFHCPLCGASEKNQNYDIDNVVKITITSKGKIK